MTNKNIEKAIKLKMNELININKNSPHNVDILLKLINDINLINNNSYYLCMMCRRNNFEMVKLLVKYGADVNYKCSDYKLPIYETSDNNIKQYLREHGAKYSFFGFKY